MTRTRTGSRWARTALVISLACLGGLTVACGDDDDADADAASASRADVIEHYAAGVEASYRASLASAEEMDAALEAFAAAPTAETLEAAQQAWLAARDDYGPTEAFRFYGGPIDNEETGKEGEINPWPLDEVYVDYVVGNPTSGIVNDTETVPTITAEALTELNEQGGEANISTGWHAIEFLLWGQDLSADGPGARPVTDFTTEANAERRLEYLSVTSDKLIADLGELVDAWAPENPDNYRAEFAALDEEEALRRMLVGMGELSRGELAGERMNVAYTERSEEDEHSCFSDNTTADFVANQAGIRSIYTGDYPGLSGPGLSELVAEADPDLDAQVTAALEESVASIAAIPAPFDQLVQEGVPDSDPGRQAILASIVALEEQGDLIVGAGERLGVTVVLS